ncbi:NAD-dependent nucleoside-diphosphate-sugar epimerase protein [Rhizobium etli 8C-3]|uniref:NAD-dependent nucleoside-diphosphate-sugar epimerase protein n=1 Tax=Rhizobium etli 8C-3 TaxID=538025 RepID=A0A1L5P5A6_RHIET|nr:SDR family oxidoreductase [Rhizobium etli]APO75325.1 NAD-dependent nucleoside-diphosphate-sugar epimerase protein [Rhizobium etli 8C-3]
MNILILGATGFIGSAVAARLVADGHAVSGLGRTPVRARTKWPDVRWLRADLAHMTTAVDWQETLKDQHVVVNCAGALQDGFSDDLAASQADAMLALYAAAKTCDVRLIVQISANADTSDADLPFLATKCRADDALASSGLPYVILRPALVVGRNSHGGSALLRALASMPFGLLLIHSQSPIETVDIKDVAAAVSAAVCGEIESGNDITLASSETLMLCELVKLHRQWLGLPPAPIIPIPAALAKPLTWLADFAGHLGWHSPLRSTAMAIMSKGIASNGTVSAIRGGSAAATLAANPSGIQDLWFARLYLLKPLIAAGLALFWLLSGIIPLLSPQEASQHLLAFMPPTAAMTLTLFTCAVDIALGAALIFRPLARKALLAMLAVSLAYLAGGTLLEPSLWLDPLGPLIKVLPSLLLTLVTLAILDER